MQIEMAAAARQRCGEGNSFFAEAPL